MISSMGPYLLQKDLRANYTDFKSCLKAPLGVFPEATGILAHRSFQKLGVLSLGSS